MEKKKKKRRERSSEEEDEKKEKRELKSGGKIINIEETDIEEMNRNNKQEIS